jgi:terminase small subunit-like protein
MAGRPTKFSQQTIDQLCEAVADGMPIKGACTVAGIGVTTLAEWRERHPELEEKLNQAREFARQKALQAIKGAGAKDWRASAEWLRLTFPSDYRGNGNKIEVSANATAPSFVFTEEQRLRLIERRAAALRGIDNQRHSL